MSFNIKLQPSGIVFDAESSTSILDSALSKNINIEYSCKDGSCGSCKANLLFGEVEQGSNTSLTAEDVANGIILTCCSKPKSDIEIGVKYYPELSHITKKTYPCKLDNIEFYGNDIALLTLRLPPTSKIEYLAGQFVDLIINGQRRSYSIANAPDKKIELHIRKVPNGLFSEIIFNELKPQQLLRLEGPQGTFFVRENSRPLIFLAGGTGFAPVKAMVEELITSGDRREIHIYWGMPESKLFYSDIAKIWAEEYSHIQYVPVISGEESAWHGRTGFVHKAVIKDFPNLSHYSVYACGSLAMISIAHQEFVKYGLAEDQFFSDAFVPSK